MDKIAFVVVLLSFFGLLFISRQLLKSTKPKLTPEPKPMGKSVDPEDMLDRPWNGVEPITEWASKASMEAMTNSTLWTLNQAARELGMLSDPIAKARFMQADSSQRARAIRAKVEGGYWYAYLPEYVEADQPRQWN